VFTTEIGQPLQQSGAVRSSFRRAMRFAGLPQTVRFYDLRHACVRLALASNVNSKLVSEMLGYSTVAITLDIYSHLMPTMQRDAARAIDEIFG
jgi:integrase